MSVWEIEGQLHTAKGYREICKQELAAMTALKRHHFEDDFQWYDKKLHYYNGLITSLERKRHNVIVRRTWNSLAAVHGVVVVIVAVVLMLPR